MASGSAANDLNFYPAAESQTLGVITAPYTDGSGDKGELRFGGTTTGNTVQSIGYLGTGMHYGYMYKEGSSTWTVNGDVAQGILQVNAGTLIINGKFTSLYQGFNVPIKSGARRQVHDAESCQLVKCFFGMLLHAEEVYLFHLNNHAASSLSLNDWLRRLAILPRATDAVCSSPRKILIIRLK